MKIRIAVTLAVLGLLLNKHLHLGIIKYNTLAIARVLFKNNERCTHVIYLYNARRSVVYSKYKAKFRVIVKYDKRTDFSFDVISLPFLVGNIPNNLSHGVFTFQLVRYAKINSTLY